MAIHLKDIPEGVMKIILRVQGEIKSEKGVGQFSQPKTIYKIINDYDKLIQKKPK